MAKVMMGSICLSDIDKSLIRDVVMRDGTVKKYLDIRVVELNEPRRREGSSRVKTHFISDEPRQEERVEGRNYFIGDLYYIERPSVTPPPPQAVPPFTQSSELPW